MPLQVRTHQLEPGDCVRLKSTGERFRVLVVLRNLQAILADSEGRSRIVAVKDVEFVAPYEKSDETA